MLTIKMFSHQLLDWIEVGIHDPKMQSELLTLLKREEAVPKMAKAFRDAKMKEEE